MSSSWYIVIRMGVVLAFLAAMPVLALPAVQGWLLDDENAARPFAIESQIAADTTARPEPQERAQPGALERPRVVLAVPSRQASATIPPRPPVASPPVASPAVAGDLEQLQQRFERLGATYLALEQVGVEGTRYRFTCHLPLRAGSPYQKRFQGLHSDAATAMRQVLAEVESWRLAEGPPSWGRPEVRLR